MRPIQPAENYNVISFARAMNDDFGPKVKKLFDSEREAALDAQETGRCVMFYLFYVMNSLRVMHYLHN